MDYIRQGAGVNVYNIEILIFFVKFRKQNIRPYKVTATQSSLSQRL